jgi:hypothetical protein
MEQITGQAPSAISPTVPYLKTKDPVEFYQSWIQSPEYERRQLLTGYSPSAEDESLAIPSAAASRQTRLESLQNIDPITYSTRQPSESRPGVYGIASTVNINPLDYIDTNRGMVEAHELAHIAGAMESEGTTRPGVMSAMEQEIFKKSMLPMKEPVLSGAQGSQQREASKRALEDFKHSQEPDEVKADLDALRFMMYDKGIYDITKGKKFTETDFEKSKQSLGKDRVFNRLEKRVGKKNFVNLMNTIASADNQEELPMAMGGMSIPGSVGFTYARTAGSAPSEGKYAKKTMASAQKGKDIEKDAMNLAASNKIAQLQLLESPEYQYRKYLESLPQLRQAPGFGEKALRAADVATDVMQLGNFIPNPIAQAIAKVGNVAGTAIDAYQAAADVYEGNYTSAGLNAASAVLPSVLGANTFRRNSKYLQPGQPLYQLSPQARGSFDRVNYIEPFTKVKGMTDKSLMANRALLGTLGVETAYDAGTVGPVKKEYGGEIPSAQNGIMSPLLLGRKILEYIYPSEEAANTVEAAPANYKKGLTNELLQRQAYKESTFNPAAVSPAGYKGLTQIGEGVLEDYSNKKGGKKLDPFNPEDAVELQKFAMNDLYNASFINKPDQSDSVRIAKTLAAYNWGRGNLANYLNEQKSKGVDIYDSYDWLNNLPKETSDYVNKILLQEDPSFNKNYKKASTNPKYEEVTSLYDQKKFGDDIPSAQGGKNDIEKISINDPRYPEMYKNRQVGLSYDGTISLPDLDEVTVTAPRSYTMDSLRDFTSAALYGAPANTMKLSMIPQAAMTEGVEALRGEPYDFSNVNPNFGGFTSNQRDLSQTMGYENPEGFAKNAVNFGLSMVDPLNVIGLGGARNLVKPSKSIFTKFLAAYDPRNLKTQSGLDWSKRWYEHPELLQRKRKVVGNYDDDAINKAAERSSNDFVENAKESLNQYEPKSYIDLLKDKGSKDYFEYGLNTGGLSYGTPDQIYINRPMYFPFDKKGLESVRVHELSHLVNRNGRGLTSPEENMLLKPLGFQDGLERLNKLKEIKSGSKKKWESYYTDPTEIKARMDQARFDLNLSPKDKFTPEMFDKISKNNNFYGMGKYIKDKDSFVDLMNKFWAVPAVGVAVGAQAADQQKNGGITKDNQGYWNPNNWGKPVEIDSNDITMEGVYEPLLGVSDTGDTKLMKPGKNYKFKGKKVTEYPVGKLGINQLDAQPMKKLNQLLNFTNNPDKNNWLDKYN